jgi:hypothetical protein
VRTAALGAAAALALAATAIAATPGGDPAAAVAAVGTDPSWVAWSVPGTDRAARTCCYSDDWRRAGCSLADTEGNWGSDDRWNPTGAPRVLHLLAEIDRGVPVRLLAVGAACPIATAGQRLTELGAVSPAQSLALLDRWSRSDASHAVSESVLAAIAGHAVPEAAERLAAIGRDGHRRELRGQALFWLAQTADARAAAWIRAAIHDDSDGEARDQAIFALAQLDDATAELLALLHEDRDAHVRRQALFWLAQSNDPRALAELDRILNDGGTPGGSQP